MNLHEKYMQKTLELAALASGHTSPNPLVGCVIVRNGKIISEGWHKKAGLPHAEAVALEKIKYAAKGATLYTNLEPCCHRDKRTPPCTDAIIKYGIKKVVSAMQDPNPKVKGKGYGVLKKAGITVISGVLENRAKYLNRFFIKNQEQHKPYIIMKAGMSLDGKIALSNGMSQWITGKGSRADSQLLRKSCDAIAAGIGTILKDDPFLDCRIDKAKHIKKVVFDSGGRLPLDAKIFTKASACDIYVITRTMARAKIKKLSNIGVNVIIQKGKGRVDTAAAVKELYNRGIRSMVVEGGSAMHGSFLKGKLYDEAWLYVAPIIIGSDGIGVTDGLGLKNLSGAVGLDRVETVRLGKDVLIKGEFLRF
jgi:diaminohydroxyphosphoribosylaminopyrimidine deaminase/5-amino-6-(5-phosphoribosylamino)uracil reductase